MSPVVHFIVEVSMNMNTKPPFPLIGVVDDDSSVREGIGSLIRSAGFSPVMFESAEAFLSRDHKHDLACLIVDMHMRELSGLELQRKLAKGNTSIPIIFVTAYADDLRETALSQGAVAVLGKPFSAEDLLGAIQSALKLQPDS